MRARSLLAPVLSAVLASATISAARAEDSAALCARTAREGNVAACQAAVRANPADLPSRKSLALAYLSLNDDDGCFRAHDEILAMAPEDPDSHYGFAAALMTFGHYETAVPHARNALRLNPDDLATVQLAATLFEMTRKDDEAFAAFRRGAELGDPLLMVDLASAYRRGLGTVPDAAAAFVWLERAARSGHVGAMISVSEAYARGEGVTRDEAQAAYWAARARAEGAAN
jgi:tetratricopeptide (TPR) repeat protein